MQTESLFEAVKPAGGEPAQTVDETPRVLSVGVFPRATVRDVPAEVPVQQGWFARLMNLFRRKQKPEPVAPVQTEWSLDRVTVVRNDLSDTDFEVVVAKTGAEPKAKGKSLVGRAWKRTEVSVANPEPVDTVK